MYQQHLLEDTGQVITKYIELKNSLFFKIKLDYNHMSLFYVCALDCANRTHLSLIRYTLLHYLSSFFVIMKHFRVKWQENKILKLLYGQGSKYFDQTLLF